MKVKTFDEAIKRYGPIDFDKKEWPDQHLWMKSLLVPDWFPYFKSIYCNIDIHEPLKEVFAEISKWGLCELITSFDGCFNIRPVRGMPLVPSVHSYGLGIDLNAHLNKLGDVQGEFFNYPHDRIVAIFLKHGFSWGGDFKNRTDPMHFSYAWE